MRTAELLISPEWPDTPESWLTDLADGPSFQLWWPVASLPTELGWIRTARTLPDDPSGQYFVLLHVSFYAEDLALSGVDEDADGAYPEAEFSYEKLAYLIAEADNGVYGAGDPPPAMRVYRPHESRVARPYPAFLRLSDRRTSAAVD